MGICRQQGPLHKHEAFYLRESGHRRIITSRPYEALSEPLFSRALASGVKKRFTSHQAPRPSPARKPPTNPDKIRASTAPSPPPSNVHRSASLFSFGAPGGLYGLGIVGCCHGQAHVLRHYRQKQHRCRGKDPESRP